jgi:hypothetical protein
MSDPCETLNDPAAASDELVSQSNRVANLPNTAVAMDQLTAEATNLVLEAGTAADEALPDRYTPVDTGAQSSDSFSIEVERVAVLTSGALAADSFRSFPEQTVSDSAQVSDSLVFENSPSDASGDAVASSEIVVDLERVELVLDAVRASDAPVVVFDELVSEAAIAAGEIDAHISVDTLVDTSAEASGNAVLSNDTDAILFDAAVASDDVFTQLDATSVIASMAIEGAYVFARDPRRVAWTLNPETTASAVFDNFGYESIVQTPDGTFGVNALGLFELTGADDAGDVITAVMQTGLTDFGAEGIKHVDAANIGYKSSGALLLTPQTFDQVSRDYPTFELEKRDAADPRTSRFILGRGAYGRYWRFELVNKEGADFDVRDSSIDVAVSPRRY